MSGVVKLCLGTALFLSLAIVAFAWWAIDRPFGDATCWVNFKATTYAQAKALESQLSSDGLDAKVDGLKAGRPPALPVVTVHSGFFQSEESLEEDVRRGMADIGGGRFDQCRTPSFGD
jgi:hypothetical protein